MAAVTLAFPRSPLPQACFRRQASVGTTLQEFVLPRGTRAVTVQADAPAWVQLQTATGTPTHGDAVSTTTAWEIPVADGNIEIPLQPGAEGSVLVAAQTGTCTVYVACQAVAP